MTTTIMAVAEPGATPPRVRLNVTTDRTYLTIYRVDTSGGRFKVRTYDDGPLAVVGSAETIYDSEIPQGQPVTYTTDDVVTTVSGSVLVESGRSWLIDPAVPSRSLPVRLATVSSRTAAASQSIRYPIGAKFPVVANDGVRKAGAFTLTVRTDGQQQLDALEALLANLGRFLLNISTTDKLIGVTTEYVAIGDLTRANPTRWAGFRYRELDLPCSVTSRPIGGVQAFNTYAKSRVLYSTYAARKKAHATYGQAFNAQ